MAEGEAKLDQAARQRAQTFTSAPAAAGAFMGR
jgi:hypothetical protein